MARGTGALPTNVPAPPAGLPGAAGEAEAFAVEPATLADQLPRPGFLVFDPEGKLHCANAHAFSIIGRQPDDTGITDLGGFIGALAGLAADPAQVEAQCRAAAAGAATFFSFALPDGRQIGIETDAICSVDGCDTGAAWIVSELGDRTWRSVDSMVIGPISRAAMAASPDAMMIADTEGRVIAINATFTAMWGITAEQIVGKARGDFVDLVARQVRESERFSRETLDFHSNPDSRGGSLFEMRDGRWIERYTAPLLTSTGEILGRIAFHRDITSRHEAMEKVEISTAQLRSALALARIGPWELDFETMTFTLNDMFYALHHRTVEELGGYSVPVARFCEIFVHPDHVDVPGKMITAALADATMTEFLPFGHPVMFGDGRIGQVAVRGSIIRDAAGKPVRAVGVTQDVTEQRALDAQLAERQRLNELLVEQNMCGICIMDADGRLAFANTRIAGMLEVNLADVLGRPVMEFVPADELPAMRRALHAQIRGRRPFVQLETRVRTSRGTPVDILVTSCAFTHEGRPAALIFVVDVSQLHATTRRLEQVSHTRRIISACNSVLIRATSEEELLRDMCRVAVEEGTLAMAWIGYKEHDAAKSVRPVAHAGVGADYVAKLNISWDVDNPRSHGPSGLALTTGRTQVSGDMPNDPRVVLWKEAATAWGFNSSVCLPLKQGDEVFGVLNIYSRRHDEFMKDEIAMLEEMAGNLAFGINTHRTRLAHERDTRHLQEVMVSTIGALGAMIEQRDPYTAGHQRNVAKLAGAIARDLGLDAHRVQGIELGSLVHDIGKIRVPAEILTKPGKLSDLEFQIIKMHPEIGREIVQGIDFPWPIQAMVAQHHERLDGSGYPAGLKGDEIPLESRILAVADVVEAITARRPYRAALGIDVALAEISAQAGTHFDATVVAACVRVFNDQGFSFE